jgi:hypothetical protein
MTSIVMNANIHYQCTIKDIKQVSLSKLMFDIWLDLDKESNFQIQSLQAGIDFNYDEISNGGQLTASLEPTFISKPLVATSNNSKAIINQISKQILLQMTVLDKNSGPFSGNIKLGTITITNNKPFTSDSKPKFKWHQGLSYRDEKVKVVLLCYENNSQNGSEITNLQNHTIVDNNLVLNPSNKNFDSNSNEIVIVNKSSTEIIALISGLNEGELNYTIFDLSGNSVYTGKFGITCNQNEVIIDVSNLKPAMYILKVANETRIFSQLFEIK